MGYSGMSCLQKKVNQFTDGIGLLNLKTILVQFGKQLVIMKRRLKKDLVPRRAWRNGADILVSIVTFLISRIHGGINALVMLLFLTFTVRPK